MVGMNLPGAQVAAVAGTLRQQFGSAYKPGFYPDYGLSARFDVAVGNLKIGRWTSCGGLGISFNPEEIKTGGRYDRPSFTPGRMGWGEVTLERAMDVVTHKVLDDLLRSYTKSWVNWTGDGSGPSYQDKTVVIKLLAGSGDKPIAEWTLHNALIKSWSGPMLDGGKSQVATEKLVFVHSGFWENAQEGPKVWLAHATTGDFVLFDHFPEKYNFSQGIKIDDESGAHIRTTEMHVTGIHERKVSLSSLRVSGKDKVKDAVNQLFDWLIPEQQPSAGAASSSDEKTESAPNEGSQASKGKAPALLLTLGQEESLLKVKVVLREVKVDFVRFNSYGSPICVDIDLTLVQTPPRLPFLNPTSGGRTANRAHLVSAGDNLQRIAQDTYHDPQAWRMIAATNDIDDPLRVRVGNTLLLPGTAE